MNTMKPVWSLYSVETRSGVSVWITVESHSGHAFRASYPGAGGAAAYDVETAIRYARANWEAMGRARSASLYCALGMTQVPLRELVDAVASARAATKVPQTTTRLPATGHWSESSHECARMLRWLDEGTDGPMDRATMYAVLADFERGKWDREHADMCAGYKYDEPILRVEEARLAKAEDSVHMADDYYTCGG